MDEVFGRVGGKYKISVADSTMMWIVHRAMDKAHERAQGKEGVIECLSEISKFYELAVMQLEGCLRFVQEEPDTSFESSDEEIIGDLAEIRDRLLRRLQDAQLAIADKDRELTHRFESELSLRNALATKQKELDSLRAKMKNEVIKTEGVEELIIHGNKTGVEEHMVSADEERDEDISGLKHSLDQQVWNIKKKLEPESKMLDRRRNRSCDGLKIELMGLDIDTLKETLDIAFGKMQRVMFSSEVEPVEQQWRYTIEKETLFIAMKGFTGEIQKSFCSEINKQEKQVSSGWLKHLSNIIKEIKHWHYGLQTLSLSDHESKISVKPPTERASFEESNKLDEEDEEDNGGHLVAKLIKNHESIIKRKSKELKWANREREVHGEKGWSWSYLGGEEDPICPRKRIQDVIGRMENLINQNEKISNHFSHHEGDVEEESCFTKRLRNLHGFEDMKENVNKNEAFRGQIRTPKEEEEDLNLQTMILKKTCATLLKGLVSDSSNELHQHKQDEHENKLKKMVKAWNEEKENNKIDFQITEEICFMVCSEVVNDFYQHSMAERSCLADYNLQGTLREEISQVLFKEICREWNGFIERTCTENLVRENIYDLACKGNLRDIKENVHNSITKFKDVILEKKFREEVLMFVFGKLRNDWEEMIERSDTKNLIWEKIYQIVLEETLRDIIKHSNEVKNTENCINGFPFSEDVEHSIKEDVNKIFLKEMWREWKEEMDAHNFQSFINEEISKLAVIESVKDFSSSEKSHGDEEVNTEDSLIQTSSEIEENNADCGSSRMISGELLSEMENTCTSISYKTLAALDHLALSKALLRELRSCIGKMNPSSLQQKAIKEVKVITPPYSAFIPIIDFMQVFMDLKCKIEAKLDLNIIKLEGAIFQLNPLAEHVAKQKRKEGLYQKAFLKRCENLRKAETEVDLLGNQVEVLSALLDKIYNILHHYSPMLQQYFEVSDIVKMIRKELMGEVIASSDLESETRQCI